MMQYFWYRWLVTTKRGPKVAFPRRYLYMHFNFLLLSSGKTNQVSRNPRFDMRCSVFRMGRRQTTCKQTLWLLDQLGPEGRVDENRKYPFSIFLSFQFHPLSSLALCVRDVTEAGVRKVWNCPIAWLGQTKIVRWKAHILKDFLAGKACTILRHLAT